MADSDRARRRPTRVLAVLLFSAVALVAGGCGSDGAVVASAESPPRPADGSGESPTDDEGADDGSSTAGSGDLEAFCAKVGELNAQGESGDDTWTGDDATRAMEELAALAPEEVGDEMDVMVDTVRRFAELEDDQSMEAMGEAFTLAFDPAFMEATLGLEQFVSEECGIELDESGGFGLPDSSDEDPFGDGGGDDPFGEDSGGDGSADISLEDLDDIEEANEGASWVEKVSSTAILNDEEVQIIASDGTDGFGEPFTSEEAVAACEAVRTALEARQPALSVESLNGETVMARGAAGVPCAPV